LLQWPGLVIHMHELIEICGLFIQMGLEGPGLTKVSTTCVVGVPVFFILFTLYIRVRVTIRLPGVTLCP